MIRIKQLRQEANLSLRELSSKLNIAYSSLGKYERGEQQPSIETLVKIANYFNVNLDYLIGETSCKDLSNMDIEKSLGLSEDAILVLKRYASTKFDTGHGTMFLSSTLDQVLTTPDFTELLKLLAVTLNYTEEEWVTVSNQFTISNIDVETAKSLFLSRISRKFDALVKTLMTVALPSTTE